MSATPEIATSGAVTPRRPAIELTDQTNRLPFRRILPIFLGLALCVVVSSLDSVIVATALPTISSSFQAGSLISWVPSAYLLTSTCFQPLYGRFSDIFGRKAALALAMGLFMVGNLIAGFSQTIVELIVFRGIAGAGGGGLASMMQIVVSDIVSLRERGKYQGIIMVVVAFGYAVGPVVGGALAQHVGWRWCFWVTLPVSFVATCVVVFVLPLKPVQGNMWSKLRVVDYLGAFLTLTGCSLLMLPLIWGGITFPWGSSIVLAPLCSGFVVVAVFCFWEWKGAKLPIVPMYIFKESTVTGVFVTMFINGFVFFSSLFYLPIFVQNALGYDALHAGLFLIPLTVSQMATSWLAGMFVSRTGRYRRIINAGFALWSVSSGLISTVQPGTSKGVLVLYMVLSGIGTGGTMQTTTIAAQSSVSRRDMSVVTVMRNFIRLLGGTISLAVASSLVNNKLRSSLTSLSADAATIFRIIDDPALLRSPASIGLSPTVAQAALKGGFMKGFSALFIMDAALTALATIVSVIMIKHNELTRTDDEELRQKALAEELARKMRKVDKKGGTGTPRDKESGTVTPGAGVIELVGR
ncbi:MFS drug transporter [Mycena kentingensis (nom. inval.)]|nr:MFS drug transporter [Mycena kentingensis (nom. inval.)]